MTLIKGNTIYVNDVVTKGVIRDIRAYNGDLATAVSDIGSNPVILLLTEDVIVDSSIELSENIWLLHLGGKFIVQEGNILTINCRISGAKQLLFDGNGTVQGAPIVDRIYDEWFSESINNQVSTENEGADKVDGFHASQSPSANTIPVLNSAGQLWLPFNQTPILVNGQDMMSRTFYVDAVNGDDNNDGSSSAPFKTLQKAVDSVPVSGYGNITLLSDYYVPASDYQEIDILNKAININLNGYSIISEVNGTENYNRLSLFFWVNCTLLSFYLSGDSQIKLLNGSYDSTKSWSSYRDGFVQFGSEGGGNNFWASCCVLAFQANNPPLILEKGKFMKPTAGGNYTPGFMHFSLVAWNGNNTIQINSSDAFLLKTGAGHPTLFYGLANLVDENGNSRSWSDVVVDIVKDANGVSRNIISNIVF